MSKFGGLKLTAEFSTSAADGLGFLVRRRLSACRHEESASNHRSLLKGAWDLVSKVISRLLLG